ncbi:MAG TPA: EamA family transporter [Thermoleophilaceae bacterium]|nr:EamA family transporter [Thermoleophilaceae bacterium]
MDAGALGLALGAAVLHAGWNVALAGAASTRSATAGVLLLGAPLLALAALLTGAGVSSSAVPFIAASAALELAYFVLLARAYDGGEVSVIYPTARGLAPVVVLGAGAVVLDEPVSVAAGVGVLAVAAGIFLVSPKLTAHCTVNFGRSRRDVLFGVAIGVVIAAYTLIDAEGVERADSIAYLALVVAPCAALYPLVTETRPDVGLRSAATAAATFGAYLLVLAALARAPAAPVSAVRESSVVIAAILAAVVLHEGVGGRRIAGAIAVAVGVGLIAYS